jgi:hypothetical protein
MAAAEPDYAGQVNPTALCSGLVANGFMILYIDQG